MLKIQALWDMTPCRYGEQFLTFLKDRSRFMFKAKQSDKPPR